jgi:small-conductance mechanosensitive channel
VSNARIFDEPVYNYTREFPYLWEELTISIPYTADRRRAEAILLDMARRHTVTVSDLGEEALREMQRRYFLKPAQVGPSVYYRLTGDALELSARFVVSEHGVRECKDAMSREILEALEDAGIRLAGTSLGITQLPPVLLESSAPGEIDGRYRA